MKSRLITLFGFLLGMQTATAQWAQEGPKLVGTGAVGIGSQGYSVAISSDGNTAVVGGLSDNGDAGAAWIWTRSGGVWTQQGPKLVGTGAVGSAQQGRSVSISSDGNTAIVGGQGDNSYEGAAWIWTRSGGVWTQQGAKLVGTGGAGSWQGASVSLSGDGNTAIVGGPTDSAQIGAAWIWTRSGGVWTQQGSKLVGSGWAGLNPQQGFSVSLSGDGNTAVVGARYDNSPNGAVWIWTRSGGVWTQQGPKLVGTGAVGGAQQGYSVSISSDGNTVIVGGLGDQTMNGAAWIWTRSGGVWTQQGSKLVGTGAIGSAWQGGSVSVSSDGNTAIVGGSGDNNYEGAAWIWTRSGGVWTQQGAKLVGTGAVGGASQGAVSISATGTTALVGGFNDNGSVGATWVFTVAAPGASQLAFVQQPTTTVAGATISPAVTVQLQDGSGNPVSTAGVTVTLSLTSGTGALSGTLSQLTNSSGLATFNNLSIDLVGSKQLTAASTVLTSAVSSLFNITAGAAAIITVTGGGTQSTSIGALFALPLQVTVTDALLNPVSGAVVTFSAPGSGASAVLSNGGSATTNASGQASVTATANFVAGGPYTVTATVGTLPPANFSLTNLQDAVNVIPALGGVGLIGFALLLAAVGVLGAGGAFKS